MVTKHLTKAKFGMEILKFCLCLSIPGMAVLVFRVSLSTEGLAILVVHARHRRGAMHVATI